MISIKSRRPRRRFSLMPRGERSGRLRSRRPRGSLKFPLPSRRLRHFDSTFLPWAPLPSLRRHAAAGARFHKLARPSATARLRSHHVQQLPPFWIGLAWGSRSQVFIEFYGIVYGILSLLEISASVRS